MQDSDDREKNKVIFQKWVLHLLRLIYWPFIWCSVIAEVIECLPQIKNFHTDIFCLHVGPQMSN